MATLIRSARLWHCMAKPKFIELPGKIRIPILWEDAAVLAVDKPPGWMLAPDDWVNTRRNLQLALESSVQHRDFWAQSRNIKFIRYIHRLDGDTSGVLLLARSQGGLKAYSEMFQERRIEKRYLAVVRGNPEKDEWFCNAPLMTLKETPVHVVVDKEGKDAFTFFRVLKRGMTNTLVEAFPKTGRTHQIRVHLQESGHPIVGDPLYSDRMNDRHRQQKHVYLGLRAVGVAFKDPFRKRNIKIETNDEKWLSSFGFGSDKEDVSPETLAELKEAERTRPERPRPERRKPERKKVSAKRKVIPVPQIKRKPNDRPDTEDERPSRASSDKESKPKRRNKSKKHSKNKGRPRKKNKD